MKIKKLDFVPYVITVETYADHTTLRAALYHLKIATGWAKEVTDEAARLHDMIDNTKTHVAI